MESADPVLRFSVSWVMVLLVSLVLLVVIFFSCTPLGACHLQLQLFFFFDLSAVDADALDAYAITLNSDHNMCSCCILCILYIIGISNGVALGHCESSRACRPLAFQIASHCLLGRIAV